MFHLLGFKHKDENWLALIAAQRSVIERIRVDGWVGPEALIAASENILENLKQDLRILSRDEFIFADTPDMATMSQQNLETLRRWHVAGEAPSLTALCIAACKAFGIQAPDLKQAILMASILGEVPHEAPYHNNMHFRKVLLQMLRLINMHRNIYRTTSQALNEREMALLLIAACIHDLGHDGQGNNVKGVFEPGRLERRSFVLAEPYLEAAGLSGHQDRGALKIMLLTTDVSPLDDPTNPMSQMKSAYRFHFLGDNKKHDTLNLSPELRMLEREPKLALMALLLHEADIATSAGIDYTVTQYETGLYCQEIDHDEAHPSHIVDFINQVCRRRMLTDAGQKLYAANMARIYALAEDDMKAGNAAFPKPQHTDFILGFVQDGRGDSGKTIN